MDNCVSGLCLKCAFSVNLRGSRAIGPRSLWRLGWTWALSLMLACVAAFAQDPANPTREYIRLGDRLIAIENIARQITIVPPTRNVIGPGETAQFGKTVSGIPPESVRWTVDSGPGTITSEGGLYQAPILVTAVQTATIRATSTADPSAVATSSITVNPVLVPVSNSVPANGATDVIAVTKEGPWTASSASDWITITNGASGTGNGQVTYTVAGNPTTSVRRGTLTVAGTAFMITQAAGSGGVTLTPTGVSNVSYNGASLTVTVSAAAGVPWTAVSDSSWLLIDSGGSGTGNGTISYHVVANSNYSPRAGALTIAGLTFPVNQQGKPAELSGCSAIPSPVPWSGGTYPLTLNAADMATWTTAVSPSAAATSAPASGTGSAQISVSFLSNGITARDVTITVTVNTGGLTATLTCTRAQAGQPTLELRPSAVPLKAGYSYQFNAYFSNGQQEYVDNTAVTWAIDGPPLPELNGTISSTGAYTAPSSVTSSRIVVVRITGTVGGQTVTDTATIELYTFYPTTSVAAITPSTGSAVPGTFQEFLVTVPLNGSAYNAANRWPVELHFSESANTVINTCKMLWVPQFGTYGSVALVDDNGTAPTSSDYHAINTSASPTLSNSQCAVDLHQSYLYIQPSYVGEYLHLYIRFKPSFAGPKMIYLQVYDNLTSSYLVAPGTNLGTFLVPGYQPPSLAIETPAAGATVSGAAVPITGWALDNAAQEETAISKVEVYVDGTKVGDAQYGLAHATACSSGQYPGRPGCPNVGYSFAWNSASVANGEHRILVSATDTDLLSGLADPHNATKEVTVTVANTVSVAVSPTTATLYRSQTTQFTAQVQGTMNTGVDWSLNPAVGTITASGLYTAPESISAQQTVQVIATSRADGTKSAQAVVTLIPVTLSLNLTDVTLNVNQTQQFTATLAPAGSGLNWSLEPNLGSLAAATTTTGTNTYTAPSTINAAQKVTLTVRSVIDTSRSAQATIQLSPVGITVSPPAAQLTESQTQTFTAQVSGATNTAVTWSRSPAVGTISSAGVYTAPTPITATQTVTIMATSAADPSKSATATVTLTPPAGVSVSPAAATLYGSQGQQFTATTVGLPSSTVTWSISPVAGSINPVTGLYAAPAEITSQQTVTVTATSVSDPTKSGTAAVTLMPPVTVSVSPVATVAYASQTRQFTATVGNTTNTSVTWTLSPSVGTVSTAGLYTAPSSVTAQQSVAVIATSVADPTKSAAATVTLMPPVTVSVTPATATLFVTQTQQFTATVTNAIDTSVTWTRTPSVGTISASGLYTAPSTLSVQQTVTVTATSVADPTKSASATVTLWPVVITLSPTASIQYRSQARQFTATVANAPTAAVTWTRSPAVGTISSSGLYTSPSSVTGVQTVTVTATSVADSTKSASATVTLKPAEPITVFGTGLTTGGAALAADGSTDTHYSLISSPDPAYPGPAAKVVTAASAPIPPWVAQGPNSKWIGPRTDPNNLNQPGAYTYRTTFDLTGLNPATAVLSGQVASDDEVLIKLNGATVVSTITGYSTLTAFTISSGFVSGVNTLDFVVTNWPLPSPSQPPNPTGLRVNISGSAVPTGFGIALFGTGVATFGTLAADGTTDTHYTMTASADPAYPGPAAKVATTSSLPVPPWIAQGPNSKWIAPRSDVNNFNQPGAYTYRTTFNLAGFNLSTVWIAARCAVDNQVEIKLNGTTVAAYAGFGDVYPFEDVFPFTIRGGFVSGVNTLDFVVTNWSLSPPSQPPNQTGLRVDLVGMGSLSP